MSEISEISTELANLEPISTNTESLLIKEKIHLSSHGQKLFNAIIACNFDDQSKKELAEALVRYQSRYNVFTLVKSCCELFDTPKKRSLMLFIRTLVPVKDRFSYEEYYKLFFPSDFPADTKSIYNDLVPSELLEKTFQKAEERRKLLNEKEDKKQPNVIDEIKNLESDIKSNDDVFNTELKRALKNLVTI